MDDGIPVKKIVHRRKMQKTQQLKKHVLISLETIWNLMIKTELVPIQE
jgi:hypothetical protein